jgi:hypothetical protein
MVGEKHAVNRWPIDDALRAALDTALPVEHYQNVGRVAVHATWLDEVAGLILYASQGRWDMTFEHLKLAASKQRMLRALRRVAEDLPNVETRTLLSTGETRTDRGLVKRELDEFIDDRTALLDRRDRIVHSVPLQDMFGTDVEVVHPRSAPRRCRGRSHAPPDYRRMRRARPRSCSRDGARSLARAPCRCSGVKGVDGCLYARWPFRQSGVPICDEPFTVRAAEARARSGHPRRDDPRSSIDKS